MVYIYRYFNNSVAEYSEEEYTHRYCPTAWNTWLDAADTAKYAVELWAAAREIGRSNKQEFRAALEKARTFTASARFVSIKAREAGEYAPYRDRDPKKEFLEYAKRFHL